MRTEAFWNWFDEEAKPKLGARAETFAKMFEHLDKFDRPVTIFETGCARRDPADPDSWLGDGCSTIIFDRYVSARDDNGNCLISFELDFVAVQAASALIGPRSSVWPGDSVKQLALLAGPMATHGDTSPDLLYLDSFDFSSANPLPAAVHHFNELMAAMPMIRPDTLVVVDDSPTTIDDQNRAEIAGKGFLVARHMTLCGADLEFAQYQAGWTNVSGLAQRGDDDIVALVDRARAHVEGDRIIAADQLYRLILGLTTPPKSGKTRVAHGEACAFYAKMALIRQRFGTAADWYREALNADPYATDYRLDLVLRCLMPMGAMKSALIEAERAARIAPDYDQAWHILGGLQQEMGNGLGAIESHDRQLALGPENPSALLDRVAVAIDVADYGYGTLLCKKVMAISPERTPDAIHCLALMAYREHRHEDAIELYEAAIAAGCNDAPHANWNMSLALHAIGRYREGWIAHEQREFQKSNPALWLPMRRFTVPRWKGEPIEPKVDGSKASIHVHYEAGAGDNLCMVRYLPMLENLGFDVRFESSPEMVDLLRGSFPTIKVGPKALDYPGALGLQPFDYHIPTGSLAAVFGTDIDTVPWFGPYIKADPIVADRYRARLAGRGRNVGFCWSSGIRNGVWIEEYGKRKSMHFESIKPVVDLAADLGITAVALQVGPERTQHRGAMKELLPKAPSWAETAALIANLDLVITVDTAVAHLAGAMGKPVWLMCQRDGCSWHFMCWREGASWNDRSPWYPMMRVFRQREFDRPHFWGDVVAEIAEELGRWDRAAQPGNDTAA